MTTYPLATLGPTIDANGITAPGFADIYASLQASYASIYGSDVVLTPDSQDGQWIAVQAQAQADSNAAAIASYNARSPSTAVGAALSSLVKVNGIERDVPSNSTADMTLVGQPGTIHSGQIKDANGFIWALDASVTIPGGGTVTATATCTTEGAIAAAAGSITQIVNPQLGWQSATNAADATVGQPIESDAQLRQRQGGAAAAPATSPRAAVEAAIANLAGVQQVKVYENDTGTTDGNGIPQHSLAAVVLGGDEQEIIDAIGLQKGPGASTYGTTSGTYTDSRGLPKTINFYRPTLVPIAVQIDLHKLPGWDDGTAALIKAAIVAYGAASQIGQSQLYTKLYTPANLAGTPQGPTFDLTDVLIDRSGSPAAANVTIAFNELATYSTGAVTVNAT